MVKILNDKYYEDPKNNSGLYTTFPFELSPFQKFAIDAIASGNHSLSCVPTGSGKTLPALFAIKYFTGIGIKKKVIYTSPIKALSNQKYYEFTQKFPELSIGLLTGDNKINPEADVLIMTAEILQNTLYKKTQPMSEFTNPLLLFEMDFDNELGCIIHDEVHMINDQDRGSVWENIILMTPPHIQMVMLSATLDNPSRFASWIESIKPKFETGEEKKEVYLATSSYRPVPLTHYSFISATSGLFKSIKDKDEKERIKKLINKPHVILSSNGKFDEYKYHELNNVTDIIKMKQVFVRRSFVLNETCKYLVEHKMLPAVCFILSKKQIQVAAREIGVPLYNDEGDENTTKMKIKQTCEQLLRSKLPNYHEYLHLPEYVEMIELLEKGIAIHNSGVMPILREIVELMFEKGFVRLLFATETFSVGLNMPIKTVIFTDVKKFDGNTRRMFHPHEYIQSAGRAGRRGIDTVGNVIHLPNLYKDVSLLEFKKMLLGKPQRLVSKFKVSYDLIFNLINAKNSKQINPQDYINFCQQSMIQNELNSQITEISKEIDEASVQEEKMSEQLKILKTPTSVFEKYNELTELIEISKNKKQKQYQRELQTLTQNNINFTKDLKHYESLDKQREHIQNLKNDLHNTNDFIVSQVVTILDKLTEETFVKIDETEKLHITHKSRYAANLREVPCMVFAEFLDSDNVKNLTTIEHVSLFSCFTDINVNEERKSLGISSSHREMFRTAMSFIKDSINKYEDFETLERINTGTNYHIHYDLLDYIGDWCKATTIEDCKLIIQEVEKNKDIFIGDFVKAIIKINNIASEVERVAEFVGNIELLEKMKEIPHITLKYVATNQSLYL